MKLDGQRLDAHPRVAHDREVQMRPAREARVARIGDVLATAHDVAGLDADRIPVQVRIDRIGAVVVQDTHDIGSLRVAVGIEPAAEVVARDVEYDAITGREHVGTDRHRHVDRVIAVG